MHEATDLVANGIWQVAVRSRFDARCVDSWSDQFTVRSRHKNGAETELAKIMNGFADWMFYGYVEGEEHRQFRILNLMAFREAIRDRGIEPFIVGPEILNKDGKTYFYAFDVRCFYKPIRYPVVFKEGAC